MEAFHTASGAYPHDLGTDTTPGGKTVLDLYSGEDFVNPYTEEHYVPAIGTATVNGEVAYQPIETDGVVTDYVITGMGFGAEVARLGPLP